MLCPYRPGGMTAPLRSRLGFASFGERKDARTSRFSEAESVRRGVLRRAARERTGLPKCQGT